MVAKKKTAPKKIAATSSHLEGLPFGVGDKVLIRTVTMIQIGRLAGAGPDFFVLSEGGWLADSKRWPQMLLDGHINEFERSPSWVVVGRGAIVDVYPWIHALPATT